MAKSLQLPVGRGPKPAIRTFDEKSFTKLTRRYRDLSKQLRESGSDSNKADIRALRELLLMTWELIPIARENYRQYRNDRSIYALNGLVNQVREIMNDLRQLRTGDRQVKHITDKIVLPNMSLLMQHYLNDCAELRKGVSRLNREQRRALTNQLNLLMQQHGNLFNEVSEKIRQALAEYLVS